MYTLQSLHVRWPIIDTALTKRNTVNKENLTNQVLLTYEKGLLPYKQDLLTYTKKYSLTYTKNPRQIATASSHGKFSNMQYKKWCGASSV